MTFEEYQAIKAVNHSSLKEIDRSPAHYRHALSAPNNSNADFVTGHATHTAVFEPNRFEERYAIWPEHLGKRVGKRWDVFCSAAKGKEIIKEADMETVHEISSAVRNDRTARRYLDDIGESEVSLFWEDRTTNIKCKARIDFLSISSTVDLKTTKDASPSVFGRLAANYGYLTQAAFYSDAVEIARGVRLPFVMIAVEKTAPFIVQVYQLPDHVLDIGRAKYRVWLETLKQCIDSDKWPGYASEELDLVLPSWYRIPETEEKQEWQFEEQ
jgi:exodeoxyribonuclease VIII